SVTSLGDGTFAFSPGTAFQDLAAGQTRVVSFSFAATDRHGAVSNTATVTVTVTGVNDAPTAQAASRTTGEDQAVEIDLSTLAHDAETAVGDLVFAVGGAVGGSVVVLPDG